MTTPAQMVKQGCSLNQFQESVVVALEQITTRLEVMELAFKNYKEASVAARKKQMPRNVRITQRENEMIELLTKGISRKEIADELGVSKRALDNRIRIVMRKCEVESIPQLIVLKHNERFLSDNSTQKES